MAPPTSRRHSELSELAKYRGVACCTVGCGDPCGRRVEPCGLEERGGHPTLREHGERALGNAARGVGLSQAHARHLLEQRREWGRRCSPLIITPEAASAAQLVKVLKDSLEGMGTCMLAW